jgi:hypothetical protein
MVRDDRNPPRLHRTLGEARTGAREPSRPRLRSMSYVPTWRCVNLDSRMPRRK